MTNLSKSQLNKLHEKERKRLAKIKQFEVKQTAETLTVSEGLSQQKIRILGEDKISQIRQLNELNTENETLKLKVESQIGEINLLTTENSELKGKIADLEEKQLSDNQKNVAMVDLNNRLLDTIRELENKGKNKPKKQLGIFLKIWTWQRKNLSKKLKKKMTLKVIWQGPIHKQLQT